MFKCLRQVSRSSRFCPCRAAKGLAYFWWLLNSLLGLYLGARTASPSRYCQALLGIGIPENTQAALAKISIRG
jgi:hypothetical protein